jgi:dGTP triphosphohydrolase
MSIDYSKYKKAVKEKKLPKFVSTTIGDKPAEVEKLSQYTDTHEKNYFTYTSYHGSVAFYAIRKEANETKDGKKLFYVYSKDEKGEWHRKAWPENRCLYNEFDLKLKPDAPVVIHEGEKAARYGKLNYTDYVHVTWQGGSKAVDKTNFQHLKDREVILFPDNDEPGQLAMVQVAKILLDEDLTNNIKMVDVKDFPKGFDVADAPMHQELAIPVYLNKADEFDPDKYTKELKAIQKLEDKKSIESAVEKFLKAYIYIRSVMSFYELDSKELLKKEQLNDWNLAEMKGESLSHKLLEHKDFENNRVHSVFTHAGMTPGIVKVQQGEYEAINKGIYYNTYYPSNIVAAEGDVSEILEYYKWLLGDNWYWIEQYIAFMIQKPGEKIQWSPVITSVEGGGKGLLASLISSLLGHHNCNTQLEYSQMVNQFSNILMGLQFGIINELDLSSKKNIKQLTNALKKFITDRVLTIELKGRPQIKIPFFCNFMIFSNEEDCLFLTKFARRYLICSIKHTQDEINEKLDAGVKDKILDALEFGSKEIGHLLHHFQNVKIEDPKAFMRNAPKTDDFYEVVEKNRPMIHRILDERLENNQEPFFNDCETFGWVDAHYDYKTNKDNGKQIKNETAHMFSTRQQFSGLVVAADLHEYIMLNPILKNEYCTRDLIIDWCKEKCITWPNGNTTKQIVLPHGSYSRAYLIRDYEREGQKLSNQTEGYLGMHYYFSTFDKDYGTLRSKLDYKERVELKKHKTNYVEPRPKDIL